jgi:hypothetical protein
MNLNIPKITVPEISTQPSLLVSVIQIMEELGLKFESKNDKTKFLQNIVAIQDWDTQNNTKDGANYIIDFFKNNLVFINNTETNLFLKIEKCLLDKKNVPKSVYLLEIVIFIDEVSELAVIYREKHPLPDTMLDISDCTDSRKQTNVGGDRVLEVLAEIIRIFRYNYKVTFEKVSGLYTDPDDTTTKNIIESKLG